MSVNYLWLKGLHIVFMVTWFAGLFYLPRLFIYHISATDAASRERFAIMEIRLFTIMTIGAVLTAIFGFWMLALAPGLLQTGWFTTKLVLLAALLIFHWRCFRWISRLRTLEPNTDTRWLRWFNEIPTVLLVTVVLLAVVKPF